MMGAGMAAKAMIDSLKNNKALRGIKKDSFKDIMKKHPAKSGKFIDKKMEPEAFERFKAKLLKEKKRAEMINWL